MWAAGAVCQRRPPALFCWPVAPLGHVAPVGRYRTAVGNEVRPRRDSAELPPHSPRGLANWARPQRDSAQFALRWVGPPQPFSCLVVVGKRENLGFRLIRRRSAAEPPMPKRGSAARLRRFNAVLCSSPLTSLPCYGVCTSRSVFSRCCARGSRAVQREALV